MATRLTRATRSATEALQVEVLFETVREPLNARLEQYIRACRALHIVVGYLTVEGVRALSSHRGALVEKLQTLVIGAGSQRAFDAIDQLIDQGLPSTAIRVNLGYSRATGEGAKHPFYRYRPMLHSKVYLFDLPGSRTIAIIGSHNMTGFALLGLNGEAAVRLEGPSDHPELLKIRNHVEAARDDSPPYTSAIKDGYAWWTRQLMDGIAAGVLDRGRELVFHPTVVLLVDGGSAQPKKGHTLYFEMPGALRGILMARGLRTEVHVYAFDRLPDTVDEALARRHEARSHWGRVVGLEEKGGIELQAHWVVSTASHPILQKAPKPFRPDPAPDFLQVRTELHWRVKGDPEYAFADPSGDWRPEMDRGAAIRVSETDQGMLEALHLVPPQHLEWHRVVDLVSTRRKHSRDYEQALADRRPEAGSFILVSLWRVVKSAEA